MAVSERVGFGRPVLVYTKVPANHITAIIKGQRGITGDTAVRLAAFFDTTAEFWMNLQKTYELRLAEKALPGRVKKHIEERRDALSSLTSCRPERQIIR